MLSSGCEKLGPRLSHVSGLLPPLQYVLQLCKRFASRFLLCSLSKLFHISLHTNRNTETQPVPIPATADVFHVDLLFYAADQLELCSCLSLLSGYAVFFLMHSSLLHSSIKREVKGMKNTVSVCVNCQHRLTVEQAVWSVITILNGYCVGGNSWPFSSDNRPA